MTRPDKRLNAYRTDLADIRLKGTVEASRFIEATPMRVSTLFADLYSAPDDTGGIDTQLLHGDSVSVFDTQGDWAWVQSDMDGYVGYLPISTLTTPGDEPTHMVLAPRTFLYTESDLKSARAGFRSMGSQVKVVDEATTRGTDYLILKDGSSVIARHLIAIGDWMSDLVSVAETLLHTPYLWGGNTAFGVDCSGLISLANRLCGKMVLRDSDMQAESIGEVLETDRQFSNLQRGDLVFWKGHVGMMFDAETLLHSNGHTMDVALEPFAGAVERIGYLYGQPTLVRRP